MHATDTQQVQPAADVDDVGGLAAKAAAALRYGDAFVAAGPTVAVADRDFCHAARVSV